MPRDKSHVGNSFRRCYLPVFGIGWLLLLAFVVLRPNVVSSHRGIIDEIVNVNLLPVMFSMPVAAYSAIQNSTSPMKDAAHFLCGPVMIANVFLLGFGLPGSPDL